MPGTVAVSCRSGFRISALLLFAFVAHSAGCSRPLPEIEVTPIKAAHPAELQRYLLSRKPDVAQFRMRGPFAVTAALTASACGLAATGGLDYAWNSFEDAFNKGIFFNARGK